MVKSINFLMGLVVVSFITIYSILGFAYYTKKQALDQGLQQCLVTIDNQVHEVWTKDCKKS